MAGKKLHVDEGQSWLDEDQVLFANPADPSCWVAGFHCATPHNLEGANKALLKSDPLSKKPSKDFSVWVCKVWMPDNLWSYSRDQQKSVPDTLLIKGSKNPDRWRKMNASFTKYTFKPDSTLYRTVIFLADKLVKLGFDTNKLRLSDSAQIEMLCVVVCIVGVVLERSWTI